MNCETGFLHSVGFWSVPVCRSVEDPRGARHCGASLFAPQTCMRSVRLDPDHDAVMRIGGKGSPSLQQTPATGHASVPSLK